MEVAYYFKELFLSRGKLFVPDLGDFKGVVHSAYHDKSSGMMIPPRREVIFNPEIREGDMELIKYYAQKERVTEYEAANVIKDYVEECDYQIAKGRRLEIPGIGLFYKNSEGKIIYEADEQLLTTSEFYGLEAIPAPKLPKKSRKHVTGYVSVVFFLLIVLACIGTLMHYGIIKSHPSWVPVKEQQLNNDSVTPDNAKPDQVNNNPVDQEQNQEENAAQPEQKPEQKDNTSVEPAKVAKDVPETRKSGATIQKTAASTLYYVVGGCFRSEDGAKRFVQELKGKGYASEIFGQTAAGLNMVCYGSFPGKAEALKMLEKIRKDENKSAYLFHK